MLAIPVFALIVSIFVNRVFCVSKFLRPPEWNADVDRKAGFEENIRYEVGDIIQILWESDLDRVDLYLIQQIRSSRNPRLLDSSRTEWEAEWDVVGMIEGDEDSMYWFALVDADDPERGVYAQTQFFNVTAPKLETTTLVTTETSTMTQSSTSQIMETATTEPITASTTTDRPSSEETESDTGVDSESRMSKGETAGAAVGGTIGGLILIGAVGYLAWRRLARNKKDTDVSEASQAQQQQIYSSEPKAELPGDPAVETYQLGYARSPPGLHEAP